MADYDRAVLEHYGLSTPYPNEWPAEKNNSDVSDEEDDKKRKINRRKSRYQALERAVSNRQSVIPGTEKSANGVENIVQKDEPDPLGTTDSVVRTLRQLGIPLQDDPRLRNRFLLSSTTFSPALYLSQMHAVGDTRSLLDGLEVLSRSIDQKSASLKVLVESNFERFVRAKATIDNVYKEMKFRGTDPTPPRAGRHSRHASRTSFRNSSGAHGTNPLASPTDNRKKNALVKESEYGVLGIKAPLLDVSAKAEDVWGPALNGREKEENLKKVTTTIDRSKEYVELSAAIADSIKRKDYESLVEEYTRARKFADNARRLANDLGPNPPNEAQIYQIVLAARMWHDVEDQIQAFKRGLWRKLAPMPHQARADPGPGQPQDQHMEVISLLLELGVQDNPIWLWLLSRYDHLKLKIQTAADRSKVEIEVLRRRLANAEKPNPKLVASYLRSLNRQTVEKKLTSIDSADVIELWEKMVAFLNALLSAQGLLGEVVEFWQTVNDFSDGKTQRSLPTGYNGESIEHHRLSQQGAFQLQEATVNLINQIREQVFLFFAGPPPEDVSLLLSPLPLTPNTPMSANQMSGSLTPTTFRDPRFTLDPSNIPPPSPRRGEAWEKYAFWPPWSNSISAVQYLARMLTIVGAGASDMASVDPIGKAAGGGSGSSELANLLKHLVNAARERCVLALLASWNADAENMKHVEDWNRAPDSKDVTRMPASFAAFESLMLSGMQKILYISEAMSRPGAENIVLPPAAKLLQMVRSQYVSTLYKALSGMVENAERSLKKADDDWTTEFDGGVAPTTSAAASIDAGDRNVRMLLTLSNVQAVRTEVVPSLNTQFENAFSVKLTEESKTIRDVLGQIDAKLFQSYTKPAVDNLRRIIRAGISAPDWAPASATAKPREVKPYIYEALLSLVLVHSQVSTTAPGLTAQVLGYLLEQVSRELLEAFKAGRPAPQRYTLAALMQATLDVEFVAQTLAHYTTDRASELQAQVYQELDARTDNDARARLPQELPEMRAVLKRLRDTSRNEFACFRKPKRPGTTTAGAAAAGAEKKDGSVIGSVSSGSTAYAA